MKTKFLSILGLSALILMSCSKDSDSSIMGGDEDRVMVKFSSTINSLPTVRVSGINWASDDRVGIYMVNHGSFTPVTSTENRQYKISGWTSEPTIAQLVPVQPSDAIYYPTSETQKVDFIAYHPYKSNTSNMIYPIDVSNQDSQTSIDLMHSKLDKNGEGYNKLDANTTIRFSFTHMLSKLHLIVKPGTGINNLNGLTVSINGMYTKANFDLQTLVIESHNEINPITPKLEGTEKSSSGDTTEVRYESIVLPVDATNFIGKTVSFNLGGEIFTWVMTANKLTTDPNQKITELKSGYEYTFEITLNRTPVGGGSGGGVEGEIKPWEPGGSGSGSAS